MSDQYKFLLDESKLPKAWYNINADMPVPPQPVLHPGTIEPVTPDFLGVLFPMSLIMQEISTERWIEIPEPVREIYKLWRPTPLMRAVRLEKMLDTPAHIYYKYEGVVAGRLAQAQHRRAAGLLQQGSRHEGADDRDRRGAVGVSAGDGVQLLWPGPGNLHGQGQLRPEAVPPHHHGELRRGRATPARPTAPTPAAPRWRRTRTTPARSAWPSPKRWRWRRPAAGPRSTGWARCWATCCMHQSVIGLEALEQMEMAGEYPDIVIGCAGGGSNFAGFAYPVPAPEPDQRPATRIIAVEPASCPTLTRGKYAFDYGDEAGTAPIVQDAHARPHLHPAGHPRRRPALPRHGAERRRAGRARRHRGRAPSSSWRRFAGGGAVLQGRGHHPRAGERARHPRRDRRGAEVQRDRREEGDCLQPLRPRPLRHDGLRGLSPRRSCRTTSIRPRRLRRR